MPMDTNSSDAHARTSLLKIRMNQVNVAASNGANQLGAQELLLQCSGQAERTRGPVARLSPYKTGANNLFK